MHCSFCDHLLMINVLNSETVFVQKQMQMELVKEPPAV